MNLNNTPRRKPNYAYGSQVMSLRNLNREAQAINKPAAVNAGNPIGIAPVAINPPRKAAASTGLDSLESLGGEAGEIQKRNNLKSSLPYLSNAVNSFITPARPGMPNLQSSVALNRVNYAGSRAGVGQRLREADLATKTLDGNTGAYVRAAGLGRGLSAVADINERELNENAGIASREAMINAEIQGRNLTKLDRYQDELIGRDNAIKSNVSGNISNAVDKYVMGENLKTDRDTDVLKSRILASQNPELFNRQLDKWEADGVLTAEQVKELKGFKKYGGKLNKAF